MPELHERLGSLDRIPAPDLWPEILEREPGERRSDAWRRIAIAVITLAIAAAAIGFASWALLRGSRARPTGPFPITPKGNGEIAFLSGEEPGGLFAPSNVFVMRPDGSQIRQLTRGDHRWFQPVWSPDGTRIAAIRSGGEFPPFDLWEMNADGSRLRQLTHTDQFQKGPSWSPDGTELVIGRVGSNRTYDLWIVRADGSGERQLTHLPQDETGPAWSPDGAWIAFTMRLNRVGVGEGLYEIHPDGTGLRQLTTGMHDGAPAWSPDARRIALLRGDNRIVLVNADGSGGRLLHVCPGSCAIRSVSWAPDGMSLIFSRLEGNIRTQRLFLIRPDGTGLEGVGPTDLNACCATWQPVPIRATSAPAPSPAPTAVATTPPQGVLAPTPSAEAVGDIAYDVLTANSRGEIWVMHPDGTGRRRLADGDEPAWSSDGSRIVFERNPQGRRSDLAVMNADGSGLHTVIPGVRLTERLLGEGLAPAWSRDGGWIAFASDRGIELVDPTGAARHVIAHVPGCLESDPAWSPDGTRVAFAEACSERLSRDQDGIVVVNRDGTARQRIVRPGGFAQFPPSHPAWSPDGRYIAFDTEGEAGGTIYLVRPDGTGAVTFTDGIEPTWSPDGARLGFSMLDLRSGRHGIVIVAVDGTGRRPLPGTADESRPAWQPITGSG